MKKSKTAAFATFEETMSQQKHVGRKLSDGTSIWHTNSRGLYWSGWMPKNLTAEELYYACVTTMYDLVALHPELLAPKGKRK